MLQLFSSKYLSGYFGKVLHCQVMNVIELHFDAELADFFGVAHVITCPLDRRASIKDIIEAQGVPHTEVGEIQADGYLKGFDHIPGAGQVIVVKKVQVPFNVCTPSFLRPEPLRCIRFLVDVNVGKLAPLLRMLGYDTFFDPGLKDREIACIAFTEKRVVLSRDRGLLKRSHIEFGRLIRSVNPHDQLREVYSLFGLNCLDSFTRCLHCNHQLQEVQKESIEDRLEPKTKKYYNRFSLCPGCNRIYWPGSHWEKMKLLVKNACNS